MGLYRLVCRDVPPHSVLHTSKSEIKVRSLLVATVGPGVRSVRFVDIFPKQTGGMEGDLGAVQEDNADSNLSWDPYWLRCAFGEP